MAETSNSKTSGPYAGPMSDWATGGQLWHSSESGDQGGVYGQPRVRAQYDKIRALDINELRGQLEVLAGHYHEFTDESGGGGTTTCG